MPVLELKPSFAAGELSPRLDARSDIEKYTSGCRTLENFILTPYGGVNRRPGNVYIADTKTMSKASRLISFAFSTSTSYILEFGDLYFRVWSTGNAPAMLQEIVTPYLEADLFRIQLAQINDIAYLVHPDHAVQKVSRLGDADWTIEEVDWSLDTNYPAMLDENIEDYTLYCNVKSTPVAWVTATDYVIGDGVTNGGSSYTATTDHTSGASTEPGTGGSWAANWDLITAITVTANDKTEADAWVTATAYVIGDKVLSETKQYTCTADHTSDDGGTGGTDDGAGDDEPGVGTDWATVWTEGTYGLFMEDHVGAYFQIAHRREESSYIRHVLNSNGASDTSIRVLGGWEMTTYGTWKSDVQIQRSYDDGVTWETIRTYSGESDRNIATSGTEEREALYRINVANYASTSAGRAVLEVSDSKLYGLVKVTAVAADESEQATVEIVRDIHSVDSTYLWSEGAWSTFQGFPRAVSLHEQRIIFGGTAKNANTLWGSVIGDFDNFRRSTLDDASFAYQIASREHNAIQWISSHNDLLVGTAGEEWKVGSGSGSDPISATNIRITRQSGYGSDHLGAQVINDVTIFVQRSARKVREMTYSFAQDSLVANDVTLLAEHISGDGIVQTAFQRERDAIVWVVTSDGQLAGMTYEREQDVSGWHRQTTDGTFESVAVVYGNYGDEVWTVVNRTIEGATVRYLERMDPNWRNKQDDESKNSMVYLDSSVTETLAPGVTTLTGLDHLEGETVDVLANGDVQTSKVVASGSIELDANVIAAADSSEVCAGLPYVSMLQPMKLNVPLPNGTGQGRHVKIHELVVRMLKSLGGDVAQNPTDTGDDWEEIIFRDFGDDMDDSPPLYTGDKEVQVASNYRASGDVAIRQTQPYPMTILALIPKYDIHGN
tara:strand:+ start:12028 stop:14700 length:2673 start_codon:yes stop_codon:yes gene_type:complete